MRKWQGYDELTWRWAHLRKENTADSEVIKEMEEAISKERIRTNSLRTAPPDEEDITEEPDDGHDIPPDLESQGQDGPEGLISSRLRSRQQLMLSCYTVAQDTQLMAIMHYERDVAQALPWYADHTDLSSLEWCLEHSVPGMPWHKDPVSYPMHA